MARTGHRYHAILDSIQQCSGSQRKCGKAQLTYSRGSWEYALLELRPSFMTKKGSGWKMAKINVLPLANSPLHITSSSKPSDVWQSASRLMDGSTRRRPKQSWRTSTEQLVLLSKPFEVHLLLYHLESRWRNSHVLDCIGLS